MLDTSGGRDGYLATLDTDHQVGCVVEFASATGDVWVRGPHVLDDGRIRVALQTDGNLEVLVGDSVQFGHANVGSMDVIWLDFVLL